MHLTMFLMAAIATGISILNWRIDNSLFGRVIFGFAMASIWTTVFVALGVIPSPYAEKIAGHAIRNIGISVMTMSAMTLYLTFYAYKASTKDAFTKIALILCGIAFLLVTSVALVSLAQQAGFFTK